MTNNNQAASSILICGGRVVDPATGIDNEADLLIRDGRIAKVGMGIGQKADEVIDAKGQIVAPGFIDLHVHLREPGQQHKETIASGTRAAASGGFTAVCAMPNTAPVNDLPAVTRWMQEPERGAVVNVFPIAAATVGSAGEKLTDFRALAEAGAVGVTDDGKPVYDDRTMRQVLAAAAEAGILVMQHAEDTNMTIGGNMNEGATAFRLGLYGMPDEAESRIVERDMGLAFEAGVRIHEMHISTAAALNAVRRAKAAGVNVTCEVTPHHFSLIDDEVVPYDTRFKMNPPLRSAADRDAVVQAILDGTVDAIATDHAPHAAHEKAMEFDRAPFGIIGLETALALAITILHEQRRLPIQRIVELFSTNPARIIGIGGRKGTFQNARGTLAVGAMADVTIFDPVRKWQYLVKDSKSLSQNTPFDGWELTGRVTTTIVGGRVVHRLNA
jgi:dihydroorotase